MPPDDLHIWYVFTDKVTGPELLDSYRRLLNQEERQRCQRFLFDKDRHQCLVTRALVRTTLSRYSDVDPRAWRFVENAYGRPEIESPSAAGHLRFNLSHTRGVVACAVVCDDDVGIDVEDLRRRTATLDIARRHFAAAEMDFLEALPEHRRKDAFFDFWTLKEAYIKARGMGLAIPLGDFSFELSEHHLPKIRFAAGFEDDPRAWQFDLRRLTARYKLAVALRRPAEREVRIECREVIPGWPPSGAAASK